MTTLLNSELETLKKNLKLKNELFTVFIIGAVLACIITYYLGYNDHVIDSLKRNDKLIDSKKKCYDHSDVKYIILGDEN